jgi:hypothetical protein
MVLGKPSVCVTLSDYKVPKGWLAQDAKVEQQMVACSGDDDERRWIGCTSSGAFRLVS